MFGFFSPYKILIEVLLIGSMIAGIGFGIHKFLSYEQDLGYQKSESEHSAKDLATATELLKVQKLYADQLSQANNHAQEREQVIKNVSAAASASSISLRDTIATYNRSASTASLDSLRVSVNTLSTVFADCQDRYRSMAEIADRHAIDTQKLIDAWPRAVDVQSSNSLKN